MRRNLTTSQLFARFLTFCHLFSTTLISVHLILTLLNSQLSTLLSSYWLISPQFHSSNIFISPVEVTQVQTCSTAFPFAWFLWLVQVAFVLSQGNFTFGATIHTSLTSSSIVLSFTAAPSLFQLSQSFLHSWIVTSYHSKKRKSHLEPSVITANNDLQNTTRIATSLLYSALLHFSLLDSALRYLYTTL
jgi:hypothetical protein